MFTAGKRWSHAICFSKKTIARAAGAWSITILTGNVPAVHQDTSVYQFCDVTEMDEHAEGHRLLEGFLVRRKPRSGKNREVSGTRYQVSAIERVQNLKTSFDWSVKSLARMASRRS
jgi:hypothetical protein